MTTISKIFYSQYRKIRREWYGEICTIQARKGEYSKLVKTIKKLNNWTESESHTLAASWIDFLENNPCGKIELVKKENKKIKIRG